MKKASKQEIEDIEREMRNKPQGTVHHAVDPQRE